MRVMIPFVQISFLFLLSLSAAAQDIPARVAELRMELADLADRQSRATEIPEERVVALREELTTMEADLASPARAASVDQARVDSLEQGLSELRADLVDERIETLTSRLADINTNAQQQGLDILQHFGVGLVFISDVGGPDRVEGASVVDGIVRVEGDRNVRAGVILEYHTWMFCERLDKNDPDYSDTDSDNVFESGATYRAVLDGDELKQVPPCNRNKRSSGMFIAVQPGSDELVDAIGVGWMWRLPDKLRLLGERTLNIGVGFLSDPNVPVLASGFVENAPAPSGPNGPAQQARLRSTDKTGFFITASLEVGGR